jgi:hypothetical protein
LVDSWPAAVVPEPFPPPSRAKPEPPGKPDSGFKGATYKDSVMKYNVFLGVFKIFRSFLPAQPRLRQETPPGRPFLEDSFRRF